MFQMGSTSSGRLMKRAFYGIPEVFVCFEAPLLVKRLHRLLNPKAVRIAPVNRYLSSTALHAVIVLKCFESMVRNVTAGTKIPQCIVMFRACLTKNDK